MLKAKKLAALAISAAVLASAFTITAAEPPATGMYAVELPAGAYLSHLWVNTPVLPHDQPGQTRPGFNKWNYQTNFQIFPDSDITSPEYFLFGDRMMERRASHANDPVEGNNFHRYMAVSAPDFLIGAHFLQVAYWARTNTWVTNPAANHHNRITNVDAPYVAFVAAQNIAVYLGIDHRTQCEDFLAWLAQSDFEFMGTQYYIENNDSANFALPAISVFDPDHAWPQVNPETNSRGAVRYFLHRLVLAEGEMAYIPTVSTSPSQITLAFVPVAYVPAPPAEVTPEPEQPIGGAQEPAGEGAKAPDTPPAVTGDNTTLIYAAGSTLLLAGLVAVFVKKKQSA